MIKYINIALIYQYGNIFPNQFKGDNRMSSWTQGQTNLFTPPTFSHHLFQNCSFPSTFSFFQLHLLFQIINASLVHLLSVVAYRISEVLSCIADRDCCNVLHFRSVVTYCISEVLLRTPSEECCYVRNHKEMKSARDPIVGPCTVRTVYQQCCYLLHIRSVVTYYISVVL